MNHQVIDSDLSLQGEVGKCDLVDTIRDKLEMRRPAKGVCFTHEQVAQADRLEVWFSKITPGEVSDFRWFRLMKGEGRVIAEHRQDGF